MALITTDNQHYSDIAQAIRGKTGSNQTFTPGQMAQAITGILTDGQAVEATGTFSFGASTSIGGSNYADIDVGFIPDCVIIWLEGDTWTVGRKLSLNAAAAVFAASTRVSTSIHSVLKNTVYRFEIDQRPLSSSTKIRIYGFDWGPAMSYETRALMDTSLVFNYLMFKFTP